MRTRIRWPESQEGCTKLFGVFNTSRRSIYVLAKNVEEARQIAWTAGHIYHSDAGLVSEGRHIHEVHVPTGQLEQYWQPLSRAMKAGSRGTVHVDARGVYLGYDELS